ncbi:MAG: NAD-dependent epimerase/dehydratase family protein [Alphaproteobacteria bacterium]|nr:NAD-dependent epimerase/dehydratase family protein [Alphaproteobacteria bacterium]
MLLVTGAAGFIGFHVARRLLESGAAVVGLDSVNAYYDVGLKRARLAELARFANFRFVEGDIAEPGVLERAVPRDAVTAIVHLAAQAGVRHSIEAPFAYERANVAGHLSVLEYARHAPKLEHLVYASSSSVYGDRTSGPFREDDRCDAPASLYAATKRACELMSETYARLYAIPQTGLRFFTVYGPWGRPDMAYFSFTDKILRGEPVTLFGEGKLSRDFTYIDDVSAAIETILGKPPVGHPPHAIYNLGNSRPSTVLELVSAIEKATGRTAERILASTQPGDVTVTFADHSRATAAFGFAPKTGLEEGIANFVDWRAKH